MPTFEYLAVNTSGEKVSGTVLGGSIQDALTSLAQGGLQVERINQSAFIGDPLADPAIRQVPTERPYDHAPPSAPMVACPPTEQRSYAATSIAGPLVGQVSLTALSFFYRQFGTMLQAGVPIVQALDTLSNQARNPKLTHVLREIRGHVEAGRPVSAGMQRYPEVFPGLVLSMVRAGEEGGFLDHSFKLLADYTDSEIALRNLIRRVTFYPKLVLGFSVFIVIGTNAFIASLGKTGGLASPLTTAATWLWLGPLLLGIFLFIKIGLPNPRIKFNWDAFIIHLPYMGNTIKQLTMAKFGRAFGALYQGGVPINRALHLAGDACGNEYIRSKIVPASKTLETGAGITETLRSTGAFTPIVMDIMETGERTGNVDEMLGRMSAYYEDEGKTRSEQMGHVLGVVVYLAVAAYVLYMLIQFYTGYYGGVLKGVNGGD